MNRHRPGWLPGEWVLAEQADADGRAVKIRGLIVLTVFLVIAIPVVIILWQK